MHKENKPAYCFATAVFGVEVPAFVLTHAQTAVRYCRALFLMKKKINLI